MTTAYELSLRTDNERLLGVIRYLHQEAECREAMVCRLRNLADVKEAEIEQLTLTIKRLRAENAELRAGVLAGLPY